MKHTFFVEIVNYGSMPDNDLLHPKVIYVAREEGIDKGVKFLCPCGCKIPIWLPLGDDNHEGGSGDKRSITWMLQDKLISISPSIQVLGGCNSHFHIQLNEVI